MEGKQVAVFDFDADDCMAIAGAVREYFHSAGQQARLYEFSDTQAFVRSFKDSHYDMSFIGVEGMMGVETARMARGADKACPIFLASSVGDYSMEGFRLHALDYLVKPVSADRVGEAVKRIGMECLQGTQGADYG